MKMNERTLTLQQKTTAPIFTLVRSNILQRKCACGQHTVAGGECAECRKKRLQRKAADHTNSETAPPIVHEVLRSLGESLDSKTRGFMEARFNHDFSQIQVHHTPSLLPQFKMMIGKPNDRYEQEADQIANYVNRTDRTNDVHQPGVGPTLPDFSQVRIHRDQTAVGAAQAVNAQAFTVGHHIIFNAGRYTPQTEIGRNLLAHELTHYLQQQSITPRVQRRLRVNPHHPSIAPATDPAASLTSAQRFSMMDTLVQSLCNEFEVDSSSGEVRAKSLQSLDRTTLAAGSNPTGCCCLSVLTDTLNAWTIQVSQVIGPRNLPGRQIILSPTNTPVEFGSFTSTGSLAFQGAVPAAGHEICGHAALEELSAHPPPLQSRLTTDVHDPTVRIENLISSEQRVPATDLRGLAASGRHRGESVDRITIRPYPLNQSDVSSLPTSEQNKLRFAADYIVENDSFVDILGHSDSAGSSSVKQRISDERANKAKTELISRGVPTLITGPRATPVSRFTRVEGLSDRQPPPPPLNANQANWRRVELLIAGFPAGAQNPPAGTPTTVTPHRRSARVPALRSSSDACIRHLVRGAYP